MAISTSYSRALALTSLAGLIMSAPFLSGCGGATSTSAARIRAFNTVPNGGAATIYINSGSANGSQNFGQFTDYLYLQGGTTTFNATVSTPSSLIITELTANLSDTSAYTVLLTGRSDAASGTAAYPHIHLLEDNPPTAPTNSSELRVVHAAPDAGTLTATFGTTSLTTSTGYYGSTDYIAVPAGSGLFTAQFVSGTTTYTATSNITLKANKGYTAYVIESAVTPTPTYEIQLLQDN